MYPSSNCLVDEPLQAYPDASISRLNCFFHLDCGALGTMSIIFQPKALFGLCIPFDLTIFFVKVVEGLFFFLGEVWD